MADKATEKAEAPAAVVDAQEASASESKSEQPELAAKDDAKPEDQSGAEIAGADGDKEGDNADEVQGDAEAKADNEAQDANDGSAEAPAAKSPSVSKAPARRKSGGAAATRKSLSKKASKARMTHLDAKPGDHFLVKLKGFPEWPAVICDESMLPHALITSRPVTAARPDGTFGELYADGGKRAADRNFPVMYLFTNEFGWVVNTALTELTGEMAENALKGKLRKDLRSAFELAAEQHPLNYFKDLLQKFEEETIANQRALEEAAATPKPKKGKAKKVDADGDEEMAEVTESTKKAKKRKAEDDTATPQRSDSVKKPKIKLNTSSTPKAANGAGTTSSKDASAKASKPKPKKAKDANEKKTEPKEKMTPEERHARKEKEVLYLRHKLQRGLLTGGDQTPKPDDMPQMSDYITMLENFAGLEVSIIRTTKINKVLKAILKLESIPREDEFKFKTRSQKLLEKWNKLIDSEKSTAATTATNGVNGTSDSHKGDKAKESDKKKEDSAAPKEASGAPEKPADSDAKKTSDEAPAAAEADPVAA